MKTEEEIKQRIEYLKDQIIRNKDIRNERYNHICIKELEWVLK